MNEEKQIEEMAYEMTQYKETVCKRIEHNNCLLRFHTNAFVDCHFCKLAEHLITEKDYRKASDVAREIFKEIEKVFGVDLWLGSTPWKYADYERLKKKYTEEEG